MINVHMSSYDLNSNLIEHDKTYIDEPRQCMHCSNTGTQILLDCFETNGRHDNYQGIALFSCPLCGSTSVHFMNYWGGEVDYLSSFETIPPLEVEHLELSWTIQVKFPSFCKIYSQSEKAEMENLDQIAGMGYRKALEFLVTDYLIAYPVEGVKSDWLKDPKTTLGNKISKIPNQRIQKLAKAISFIGNDETHYTRQHPEHDINSIKAFVRVLISEIQNEVEYEKAVALINKSKS
ncbi:DUF4145 domain-containing protein [Paraliobacillus sp. X-1268]|uniref:DUF4145 domain-containing protein n=1 Tax=Paraliobacillus sp. X-1268 TaxID=2213193 RepID=UPI000E3DAA46|nr:DUF4145 domain-containing protein [Paraliobacillus sp. X-1268]